MNIFTFILLFFLLSYIFAYVLTKVSNYLDPAINRNLDIVKLLDLDKDIDGMKNLSNSDRFLLTQKIIPLLSLTNKMIIINKEIEHFNNGIRISG
nr:MAG: wsv321-like protein [Metapenaeopsis lamellata majanivirus]